MSAVQSSQQTPRQSTSQPLSQGPAQAMPVKVWGATDRGREREGNEDYVYPHSGSDTLDLEPSPQHVAQKGQLLIVADGVGGAKAGSQASRWATRVTVEQFYDLQNPDLSRDLRAAVAHANASLHQYLQSTDTTQAGSTMVAAVIHQNLLYVANVGDSRAYLIRNGEISQLTIDHTLTQRKLDQKLIRPEQAEMDPDRSVLTRSLGAGPKVQVDVFPPLQLAEGDTVLLCSDGLTDMLKDPEIAQIASGRSPKRAARQLISAANKRGGYDNISIVVARVGSGKSAVGAGLLADIARMSGAQKTILGVLGALAVLVFCSLMVLWGWTRYDSGQATPTPTGADASPAIEATTEPATEPIVIPTESQPSATPPTDATSTPMPTPTPTDTPRPAPTSTPTPIPTPQPESTEPQQPQPTSPPQPQPTSLPQPTEPPPTPTKALPGG